MLLDAVRGLRHPAISSLPSMMAAIVAMMHHTMRFVGAICFPHAYASYCSKRFVMQYGDQDVQLSAAEQLVDRSQTRAVADALKWLQAQLQRQQQQQQHGGKTLLQWLHELDAAIDQQVSFALEMSNRSTGELCA
jgi:hypothetical protein